MSFEDNLKKLNINLPSAASPVGSYVATKIVGKYLFISGQISIDKNGDLIKLIGRWNEDGTEKKDAFWWE